MGSACCNSSLMDKINLERSISLATSMTLNYACFLTKMYLVLNHLRKNCLLKHEIPSSGREGFCWQRKLCKRPSSTGGKGCEEIKDGVHFRKMV